VAVIQIGKEQLLVGVSPGGISRLYLLPEPLEVAPAPTLPDFADLLAKRLRKGT
jgi:flagellar protein FliO/FliZ